MTEQEIEKLREKLGSDYSVKRLNGAITVELVDIWNGVEFAECVQHYKSSRTVAELFEGQIYRITDWFKRELVYFEEFEYGFAVGLFKPSTESAYVEQLKSKAKELYGEIKDGDRFQFTWISGGVDRSIHLKGKYDFYYDKESDTLYLHGFHIYKQGKWARKIERVRVVPSEIHYPKPYLDQYVTVELRVIGGLLDAKKSKGAADELAKCLEDYLNKIP